ncbi:MAG: circadian clock protein KaiC [Alphaproteobacteria bacterium]|nr:circadian clock protein KaiC [Alphaproteobacteria bacterium]
MTVPRAKLGTGIPGFDALARGGLPRAGLALVLGDRGSGRTTFGLQVLGTALADSGGGVFVAFDETPAVLEAAALELGLDVAAWRGEGRFAFVDGVPDPSQDVVFAGDFDLGALLARIEAAVAQTHAERVVIDSLDGLLAQVPHATVIGSELRRLAAALGAMGVTTVVTAALDGPAAALASAIADTVVRLERARNPEHWPLSIEIAAMRGAAHLWGRHPVVMVPGEGLAVLAPPAFETEAAPVERMPTGNPGLDHMLGGGLFRDSLLVLRGAPGSGKSVLAAEYLAGGAGSGDRCALVSFADSRARLVAEAASWAIDMERMEADRRLAIVCARPDGGGLADHLHLIETVLERFKPRRVVVDGLVALARACDDRLFRLGLAHLTGRLRQRGVAGLLTWPVGGRASAIDLDLMTHADAAVVLDDGVATEGVRTIAVVKMRGSWHERVARSYVIDGDGFHIGRPWHDVDLAERELPAAALNRADEAS